MSWPPPTGEPIDRREPWCIDRWHDCVDGAYNPWCCRFPKSCLCENLYWETREVQP